MRNSIADRSEPCQSTSVDGLRSDVSTAVDRELLFLRQSVSECGWTLDALEAHMGRDKSLISRVLNGERPLTLEFKVALPDDVEARWSSKQAEHFGHVVVMPLAGADAMKALVAGLVGVLAGQQMPARASQMAKATVASAKKSEVA